MASCYYLVEMYDLDFHNPGHTAKPTQACSTGHLNLI